MATGVQPLRPLTARQVDVARELARGLSIAETARALGISYTAAKRHVHTIAQLLPNPDELPPLTLVRCWVVLQPEFRPDSIQLGLPDGELR